MSASGLQLHFKGFTSIPPGDAIWALQVDTPYVGFVTAASLQQAKATVEQRTGRSDWVRCDPIPAWLLAGDASRSAPR